MLTRYVASVISITLKSPGTDLRGECRAEEKKIDLRISKEEEKEGLGHNPKAQSQADQEKSFIGFQNQKNAAHRGNICFNQTLAGTAQQRRAHQSPAGVAGISLLALASSPGAGQGKGLLAEEPG